MEQHTETIVGASTDNKANTNRTRFNQNNNGFRCDWSRNSKYKTTSSRPSYKNQSRVKQVKIERTTIGRKPKAEAIQHGDSRLDLENALTTGCTQRQDLEKMIDREPRLSNTKSPSSYVSLNYGASHAGLGSKKVGICGSLCFSVAHIG